MGQTNDMVLSKGRTRQLQKQNGHRLRQIYLNLHLELATTTNHRKEVEAEKALL
jgi:hypothetical protein